MRRLIIPALLSLLLAAPAMADTRSFQFRDFDQIEAAGGVNVVLRQGPFSVEAVGKDGALDRLRIDRQGDVLRISQKPRWGLLSWGNQSAVVTVTAPTYAAISASGGSDLSASGLRLEDVAVTASGGADVELSGACRDLRLAVSGGSDFDSDRLDCRTVSAKISGGADATLKGACENLDAASSGGADLDAGSLACVTVNVRASGGGDASVHATGSVRATATGGADVHVRGGGSVVERNASSGGDITIS